jgi:hypothetical protein
MARPRLVKTIFWSIDVGLLLMVLLDLFPAGILQFKTVTERGLWFARSSSFIEGSAFQTLTCFASLEHCIYNRRCNSIGLIDHQPAKGFEKMQSLTVEQPRNNKELTASLLEINLYHALRSVLPVPFFAGLARTMMYVEYFCIEFLR